jgi:hypothetical protein
VSPAPAPLPARLLKHSPSLGQDGYAQVLVVTVAGDVRGGMAPCPPARPADGEREVPVLAAADLPAESSARRRLYPHLDAQLADDVTPVGGRLVRRHRRCGPRPQAGIPGIKVRSCGICGRVHLIAPFRGLRHRAAFRLGRAAPSHRPSTSGDGAQGAGAERQPGPTWANRLSLARYSGLVLPARRLRRQRLRLRWEGEPDTAGGQHHYRLAGT